MKGIILGVCTLLMTGCCSCRKTIIFVEVPCVTSCSYLSVGREVRPSAPHFIFRSRTDSLLEEASLKAKMEADEATRHLNPLYR